MSTQPFHLGLLAQRQWRQWLHQIHLEFLCTMLGVQHDLSLSSSTNLVDSVCTSSQVSARRGVVLSSQESTALLLAISCLTIHLWKSGWPRLRATTKGQNRFIIFTLFTLFGTFSDFFPQDFPLKNKGFLAQGEQKRRKDNKKNWTNRCCTLVVARLSNTWKKLYVKTE